ncbi:MAG TPA: hypothetical protein VEB68_04085, partial [Croceibacterium sp.]|nr:hypothetical protein [Croceibacterium sp.]
MAAKRSKFVQRTEIPRVGERRPVSVEGTCRVAGSDIRDVRVIDLDAHGCNLRGLSIGVSKSDPLELWLGSAGPIAARLRWAKRG